MLDEFFVESWFNREDHDVMGWRLKPFCLFYQLQLEFIESPLVAGGAITFLDLAKACKICTGKWSSFIRPIKLSAASLVWHQSFRNLKEEVAKFQEYLEDYFRPPKIIASVQNTSFRGTPPEMLHVFGAVAGLTGWSEETIMMMPLGKAHWLSAVHFNNIQGVDFETPANRKLFEHLRKMQEKMQKDKDDANRSEPV